MKLTSTNGLAVLTTAALLPGIAGAGVKVYDKGDAYAEVGGRIQVQYLDESFEPAGGPDEDSNDLFFRRMRFYIEGGFGDWEGIWQMDFGDRAEDPEIKDAYMAYTGFGHKKITIGNHFVPFSREQLTSSKRQQFVERTLVGDHNYGVPDRQIGVSVSGKHGRDDMFQYAVGYWQAGIDRDEDKLDFETRANDDSTYYGDMVAGRVDFYPFGAFKMAQGDFGREQQPKVGIGVNAFNWSFNEDHAESDTPAAATDPDTYDDVTGVGIDLALRWMGLSADAAYQSFASETVGSAFTGGIIENGEGDFDTHLVKAGYMIVPNRLEIAAGYEGLSADAWDEDWEVTSVGANWFFNQHTNKVQLTYQMHDNFEGVADDEADIVYLQFQHVL